MTLSGLLADSAYEHWGDPTVDLVALAVRQPLINLLNRSFDLDICMPAIEAVADLLEET